MFVFNFRLKSKKNLLLFLIIGVVIIVAICLISTINAGNKTSDTATCDELGEYSLCAETTSEQYDFLSQLGYDVDKEFGIRNILIPTEFNSTYEEYNLLQKKIGLDLSGFKGETVKQLEFKLKNSNGNYAVLLICDGRVIGGHITNGEYGSKNLPLI